jgi:SAM-dependent methyltransferase
VTRCDDAALAAEYRDAYYAAADDPRIAAWAAAHASVWDALADQLLRLSPAAQRVLDVGAGSGGFLLRLRARRPGLQLAAVEASPAARAALQQRVPGVVFVADRAEQLAQCGDGSFDAVTMLQTIEHLRDPLAACRGALRCLRPGGWLLVTVPNRRAVQVWLRGRRAGCWANGTHLQFFDRRSLGRLLRTAGFTAVRRLVTFGGGQHRGLLPRTLQYALRALGVSTELRVAARRPTA